MPKARVMGIDYGSVRIGISVSDETNTIAFGKDVITNDKNSLSKISELIKEYSIASVVLGYPLNLKGGKSEQTLKVEEFESKLKDFLASSFGESKIEVIRWDERFTSKLAQNSLIESGMKKKKRREKSNLDIISSALLLQSYLDRR